jgi:hypothetical protein
VNAAMAVHIDDSSSLKWAFDYPVKTMAPVAPKGIRVGGHFPPWAAPVVARIQELAALPTVDPRGSRPMNLEDVVDALTFLRQVMRSDTPSPWIGRLNSGGLQLTWTAGDVEVEAVFDRARDEQEVYLTVGETEWEAPVSEAESLFASVVDRLSHAHA